MKENYAAHHRSTDRSQMKAPVDNRLAPRGYGDSRAGHSA
jgi:hypothetical protein